MKDRLKGIDTMRFFAIVAVIWLHCFPTQGMAKIIVDQTCRFAVPFFFVTSGYFLAAKLLKSETPQVYFQYIRKLLSLYLIWSLIYFLDPPLQADFLSVYSERLNVFLNKPWEEMYFVGISGHFWFFISLILTVLTLFIFKLKHLNYFLVAAVCLYIFGVLGKAYSTTTIGFSLPFNTRNFIFFSALPFGIGVYIKVHKISFTNKSAIIALSSGLILHFLEAWLLRKYFSHNIEDYGFSTFIMGVGAFGLAQQNFQILKNSSLSSLGKLTLGIYAGHILIAQRLHLIYIDPFISIWHVVWPFAVLFIATIGVLIASRIKYVREIV